MKINLCDSLNFLSPYFEGLDAFDLYIWRDDLSHDILEGNKYRKLWASIEKIKFKKPRLIVTLGGAYSNHLVAVSQMAKMLHLPSLGLVRGEYVNKKNTTLSICSKNGMIINALSKDVFNQIKLEGQNNSIVEESDFFIPEGGSNENALAGLKILAEQINQMNMDFDYIICPCATGGTILGLANYLNYKSQLVGIQVLKMDIKKHIINLFHPVEEVLNRIEFCDSYHFGGYGKFNSELITFIKKFNLFSQIIIDPIYNGKSIFGVFDLIKKQNLKKNSRILIIHTGGSQGILGYNERFDLKLPSFLKEKYILQ